MTHPAPYWFSARDQTVVVGAHTSGPIIAAGGFPEPWPGVVLRPPRGRSRVFGKSRESPGVVAGACHRPTG